MNPVRDNQSMIFTNMFYPPSQKTMGVSPWMNVKCGPAVALAKAGASADSAEEMKDTAGVSPRRLHVSDKESISAKADDLRLPAATCL